MWFSSPVPHVSLFLSTCHVTSGGAFINQAITRVSLGTHVSTCLHTGEGEESSEGASELRIYRGNDVWSVGKIREERERCELGRRGDWVREKGRESVVGVRKCLMHLRPRVEKMRGEGIKAGHTHREWGRERLMMVCEVKGQHGNRKEEAMEDEIVPWLWCCGGEGRIRHELASYNLYFGWHLIYWSHKVSCLTRGVKGGNEMRGGEGKVWWRKLGWKIESGYRKVDVGWKED